MTCYGNNVTEIPDLMDWVSHIDILQTNITGIPEYEWSSLRTMDIRENALLPCADVIKFKQSRPDVMVLSDCNALSSSEDGEMYWINLLFVIPFIIASVMGYRLKKGQAERLSDVSVRMESLKHTKRKRRVGH